MVSCSATYDDAFEGRTSSVGCAAALLPRISAKAVATWFRRQEKGVSNSKAGVKSSTRDVPFVLEIGSKSTLSDASRTRNSTLSEPVDKAQESRVTWVSTRENGTTISWRRAASWPAATSFLSRRAGRSGPAGSDIPSQPPFSLKTGSDSSHQNLEEVKTPGLNSDDVWTEMRRRFRAAHRIEDVREAGPPYRHDDKVEGTRAYRIDDVRDTRASRDGATGVPRRRDVVSSSVRRNARDLPVQGSRSDPKGPKGPDPFMEGAPPWCLASSHGVVSSPKARDLQGADPMAGAPPWCL